MINRRDAVKSTAVAALVAAAGAEAAQATDTIEVFVDPENLTDRQKAMLSIRFDTLDGESHQDFVSGFKSFQTRMAALPSATARVQALLESKGLSMLEETSLGHEECWNLLMEDPVYATNMRLDSSCQHVMWDRARRVFHKNAAHYLKLLDESDNAGPGRLELNPGLKYPDYACLEIHAQPGGYVGDPLGGWVYHYAVTLGYRAGSAFHDENHIRYANSYVKPVDGVVRRVLDIGCGTGQSTTPMKMRFPNATVWGVDVAAPFVRYAHHRARNMGLDVNFRHALGEDTGFPDDHFDMVYTSIVFHEVSAVAAREILREIFRVLRPGGTYSHGDTPSIGHPTHKPASTVTGKAFIWRGHRHHSYEPWFMEYIHTNIPKLMEEVGFKVDLTKPPVGGRTRWIGTKPA